MWVEKATEAVVLRCVPEENQKPRASVLLSGMKSEDPILDTDLFEGIIHRYPKWLPLADTSCHGARRAPTNANG